MSHVVEMAAPQQRERATRGKYAEEKVRESLKSLKAEHLDFDFERNYDARSSMGRIPARAGDFTFFGMTSTGRSYHGLLEVKQVAHAFRLPRKNFDPKKWPALERRQEAGGVVLVIFYSSSHGMWKAIPLSWFVKQGVKPSWDTREAPGPVTSKVSALWLDTAIRDALAGDLA